VGQGMQTHTGVAAQMFRVLADRNINIEMVTTSEIKISVLIRRHDCEDAVRAVHEGFHLHTARPAVPSVGMASRRAAGSASRQRPDDDDIVQRLSGMEDIVVSDVYADTGQARVTIDHLSDDPGTAARIFSVVGAGGILVDMIIQNAGRDGAAGISFTVPEADADRTTQLLHDSCGTDRAVSVFCEPRVGKLSVSGIGLRSHTDVAARLFRILTEEEINVQLINTSEIKVSVLVTPEEAQRACSALRREFQLDPDTG